MEWTIKTVLKGKEKFLCKVGLFSIPCTCSQNKLAVKLSRRKSHSSMLLQ